MESKTSGTVTGKDAVTTTPNHDDMVTEGMHEKTDKPREERSAESNEYPKGIKFVLITMSLMLAVFIMALDTSIIGRSSEHYRLKAFEVDAIAHIPPATAVPKITSSFHSIEDIGWYSSAYLLPLMSLQPTFGKLYSYYRVKPIFLGAMFTFEIGSIICATAQTSYAFIVGRVISGIGAAAIYAGGMVIITSAVPLSRLPIYLSTLSSMYALASLTGPPLGGVFTDSAKLTWRFCFWINLRMYLCLFDQQCCL
jgi:MFS family permease